MDRVKPKYTLPSVNKDLARKLLDGDEVKMSISSWDKILFEFSLLISTCGFKCWHSKKGGLCGIV